MHLRRLKTKPSARQSNIVGLDGKPLVIENRAYEASSTGRRLGQWEAPDLSPNQAAISELRLLQRRSRAAVRNNPWISRGLNAQVANEIGTGIVPRSQAPDKEFREAIRNLWNDWTPYADADGVLNAYGIQSSAARARRESGEVFVRIRRRRMNSGLNVPVQFQVLESEFCPAHLNKKTSNGNEIISGIEIGGQGRRVAYWMYRRHPAERMNFEDLVRVPADQIIHHYIPLRPGQLRGSPNAVQSLVRSYLYDKYDDAELTRKENRAHFTGVIRRPDVTVNESGKLIDPITGESIEDDENGLPMFDLEAGTFPSLLPGEDITLFEGDETGGGYPDFQRHQLLGVAAGQDLPYELTTGDYKDINDRIWRAIMNQYHREIEQVQDLTTIHQVCRVMHDSFVDAAVLAGAIEVDDYDQRRHEYIRAEHRPQAWKHIHPLQDIQARAMEKNEGFKSRQAIIAEEGWDAEDVDRQRAEDAERENSLNLNSSGE